MNCVGHRGQWCGRHTIEIGLVLALASWGCSPSSTSQRDAGDVPSRSGILSDAPVVLAAEVTPADDGPSNADHAQDIDDEPACVALDDVRDQCPVDWSATIADQISFCASGAPFSGTFLSSESCRGSLHYTRYVFDSGPRMCLYDPVGGALLGFRAVDGKSMFEQTSCGSREADFDGQGCAGTTCEILDASPG